MRRRFYPLIALLMVFGSAGLCLASDGEGQASSSDIPDTVAEYNHLWREVMIDITIIGVFFALVTLYFLFKYRRKRPDQEGKPVKLSKAAVLGWAFIPVFLFLADDLYLGAKGWDLWNTFRTPPENAYEIQLESAMWSWKFKYPGGVESYNELRVPAGKPILVRMTSVDTIHSLFIPDFKVKEDSMPGRVTYLWFYPKEVGEHLITCAEYCGMLHSNMYGKVIAMEQGAFDSWLASEQAALTEGGA
jgi:cytochrome c oxidase subunit 2